MRITEVDLNVRADRKAVIPLHLLAPIPGERLLHARRQPLNPVCEHPYDGRRIAPGNARQQHEARLPLDERGNLGALPPTRRSPSQWPGTARSAALGGRSLIEMMSTS